MASNSQNIDSAKFALGFLLGGATVGFFIWLAMILSDSDRVSSIAVWAGLGGAFGLLFWMMVLVSAYSERHRREQRRRLRRQLGIRSPWGERRTEEPTPYSDRLAHFLSHDTSSETPMPEQPFVSKMRFWALLDWHEQPGAEPKPTWFIRRILQRIHEAVRG